MDLVCPLTLPSLRLRRKGIKFFVDKSTPADASGANWPGPQTNDNIFSQEKLAYATRH
jgi:hypothetical protein